MKYRLPIAAVCLFSLLATGAAAQVPEGANTITIGLVPAPAGGANLLLRVEANEVTDLYGLGFDLQFPKKRLRWKKNSGVAGSFLSAEDTVATVVLDRQKPRGSLHVGASRVGDTPGVSGSGTMLDIGFVNRKKAGPRTLTLSNTAVFDSSGLPIPDVVWVVQPFEDGSGP